MESFTFTGIVTDPVRSKVSHQTCFLWPLPSLYSTGIKISYLKRGFISTTNAIFSLKKIRRLIRRLGPEVLSGHSGVDHVAQ
jgi:hypothetical protein